MTAQGTAAPKRLFGIQLTPQLDALVRKLEGESRQTIREDRLDAADVSSMVGFWDDAGVPHIALSKGAEATEETLATEIARLEFRGARYEKNMPYAEMRHEANRRLCRRLYRVIEQEVVLAEAEALGAGARKALAARLVSSVIDPLRAGSYRRDEADPGRLREGALDALELAIAEYDEKASRRHLMEIAEKDAGISRPLGLMYKVVENHRPFDSSDRVRAAYYLAVPFLFDARKPSQPVPQRR
jgi:hypothetical protein